jgi:serine/threonine protein kinase
VIAHQVALNQPYNEKADVYSLGIIIWEILSLQRPFDLYNVQDMHERVIQGDERPTLDENWPSDVKTLLQNCWSSSSSKRPDARYVEAVLKALYAELISTG